MVANFTFIIRWINFCIWSLILNELWAFRHRVYFGTNFDEVFFLQPFQFCSAYNCASVVFSQFLRDTDYIWRCFLSFWVAFTILPMHFIKYSYTFHSCFCIPFQISLGALFYSVLYTLGFCFQSSFHSFQHSWYIFHSVCNFFSIYKVLRTKKLYKMLTFVSVLFLFIKNSVPP